MRARGGALVVITAALCLALGVATPLHNRSEGKSSFVIDAQGRVAVTIGLSTLDLPELCNVDFSIADRAGEERRLVACVERDLARWLRIKGDGVACPVGFRSVTEKDRTVTILGDAACAALPHTLVIDWGLFAGEGLDHVSVAKIEQPHAAPRIAMLSRRASKLTVDVARPRWPLLVAGGVAVAAIAGAVARVLRRRAPRNAADGSAVREEPDAKRGKNTVS